MPATLAAIAADSPAAGAPLGQVIGGTVAALVLISALLVLGVGHRCGRVGALGRLARWAARLSGLPEWVALPTTISSVGASLAGLGLYWDVGLHIDRGRDPGPFANPSHYLILVGLFALFSAGWIAMVLPRGRPSPAAIRLTRDWYAPASGLLLISSASFALVGFPADDTWHRLFGQDVTLWGPTHLMLLGGGAMSVLATMAMLAEARLARRAAPPRTRRRVTTAGSVVYRIRVISAAGGLLAALSIFQAEFDYGIPQFRLLFHPVLLALAAAIALVAGRILAGRGAALGAVVFFLAVRGVMLVLPLSMGLTVPHFPLYLAAGAVVELAGLMIGYRRPYLMGAVAGVLIGTVGTLAEWGWSQVWMPLAWPAQMIGSAVLLASIVGVAGGVIGAFVGAALDLRARAVVGRRVRLGAVASLLACVGVLGALVPTHIPSTPRAVLDLHTVTGGLKRTAMVTVRFEPPSTASHPDWLTATAAQGREGPIVVDPLRRIGNGVYETHDALPVHGRWKTAIRLQRGSMDVTVPIYAPRDTAVPIAGISAPVRSTTRGFIGDHAFFQRERRANLPGWLWGAAEAAVGLCAAAFVILVGWVLIRLAGCAEIVPEPPRQRPAQAAQRPVVGAPG